MLSAQQQVGARGASTQEARLLHLRRGAPLLTMERTASLERARPMEWGAHVCDARASSSTATLHAE